VSVSVRACAYLTPPCLCVCVCVCGLPTVCIFLLESYAAICAAFVCLGIVASRIVPRKADLRVCVCVCVCVCVSLSEKIMAAERQWGRKKSEDCSLIFTHKFSLSHTHTHTHLPTISPSRPCIPAPEKVGLDVPLPLSPLSWGSCSARGAVCVCVCVCVCVYVHRNSFFFLSLSSLLSFLPLWWWSCWALLLLLVAVCVCVCVYKCVNT
jgi:hypothetical protein